MPNDDGVAARCGRERKRETGAESERGRQGKRDREQKNGRMRGLPRGGEESGGCGRRRVQIITIIIFPGNMAAERGWPRSSVYALEGNAGREDEAEPGSQGGLS